MEKAKRSSPEKAIKVVKRNQDSRLQILHDVKRKTYLLSNPPILCPFINRGYEMSLSALPSKGGANHFSFTQTLPAGLEFTTDSIVVRNFKPHHPPSNGTLFRHIRHFQIIHDLTVLVYWEIPTAVLLAPGVRQQPGMVPCVVGFLGLLGDDDGLG